MMATTEYADVPLVFRTRRPKYAVEGGIPIPPIDKTRVKGLTKYPWPQMDVGDSVFFACNDGGKTQNKIVASYKQWIARFNKPHRFSVRKVEGGIRVWRIV